MLKISYYQTNQTLLSKTFCSLLEKCYYGSSKALVVTPGKDLLTILDKALWTYSKKHFIPHSTNYDLLPEKQPILISDNSENLNGSKIIVFVNIEDESLLEFFGKWQKLGGNQYNRIIILQDETTESTMSSLQEIIKKAPIKTFELESFAQDAKGKWYKI